MQRKDTPIGGIMKKLNKLFAVVLVMILSMSVLAGCAQNGASSVNKEDGKLNVVATIFPAYDFLRQIAGEQINLTMLLTPGAESHSFEPTPQDIKTINQADVFVYVGGESDSWVESIMDSVDTSKMKIVTLMDCVELVEEEIVDGMTVQEHDHEDADDHEDTDDHENAEHEDAEHEDTEHEDTDHEDTDHEDADHHEEEKEYDEHVWTNPRNAKLIVDKLKDALIEKDADHSEIYAQNAIAYQEKLSELDLSLKEVVANAKRKEIIVGDRFPFRYLVDAYGLSYYAAFPGCASDTEPSAATIAFLTDKVKEDQIPVVFHLELSNQKVCDSIAESTGAKTMQLNAVHNITKDDFQNGVTYLDLMQQNVASLKEALN